VTDEVRFGPYRIEALLGRGGMGEVYRAYDESHKRTVALKVLSPHLAADENYRARFRRESELAARLREAHVIPIHRFGEIDGRLFLDMRLVDGSDLATVLKASGALSAERAVDIVSQVAQALDAAHDDGLIHRDVKPSNVLVTNRHDDGDDDFVYLVDFGIARAAEDEGPNLTMTGAAMGSFDYMAPERFLEAPLDPRTDVYSLACLLYECLTGRRPFLGAGPALMNNHLNTPPPRPSVVRGDLPAGLDEVVVQGMAKGPADRHPRAGHLAAAARAELRVATGSRPMAIDPAGDGSDSTPSWQVPPPPVTRPAVLAPSADVPPPLAVTRFPDAAPVRPPARRRLGSSLLVAAMVALLAAAALVGVALLGEPDPGNAQANPIVATTDVTRTHAKGTTSRVPTSVDATPLPSIAPENTAAAPTLVPQTTAPRTTNPPVPPPAPVGPGPAGGPPPASYGDPFIDSLAQGCFEGRMRACDDLYLASFPGDAFEYYGYTCGYRLSYDEVADRYCTDIW